MNNLTANSIEELGRQAKADKIEKLVAGAALIHRGDAGASPCILLLERAADDFLGGLVELPSGGVEPGESLTVALHREIEEETGLAATKIVSHLGHFDYHSGSGRTARQFNFLAFADTRKVRLDPKEHSAAHWLTAEEAQCTKLKISSETKNIILEAFDVLARIERL